LFLLICKLLLTIILSIIYQALETAQVVEPLGGVCKKIDFLGTPHDKKHSDILENVGMFFSVLCAQIIRERKPAETGLLSGGL